MESKVLEERIIEILDDIKAKRIESINIENITIIADYFIICSGTSTTHNRGIADEIMEKLNKEGLHCTHVEGYETARWILLDYLDVVIHIFHEEDREFYNLERLWKEGKFANVRPEILK